MDEMFGLSMTTVMYVLLGLLALSLAVVAVIFLRNRIIFMMGLRNIPRRGAQTSLIIIGLMLSTVIITAAFTTGDTVDYSITKIAYDQGGHTDVILDGEVGGRNNVGDGTDGDDSTDGDDGTNIAGDEYRRFLSEADASGLEDVDGYMGVLIEPAPVINTNTNLSEPNVSFAGVDTERMDAFPDVKDLSSGEVLSMDDLGEGEVYLNESAADELDASEGHVLEVYVQGIAHEFTVAAIVEDTIVTGAYDAEVSEGMVAPLPVVTELFEDEVTIVLISATGGVRDSLDAIPTAEVAVEELIADNNLRMEVSDTKLEIVDEAEEIGNFMTSFFLLLGLFSISAGMLLIVMIFVMLAAERKSEMGMARAVGTKRRHLIEMFIAEGVAYNLAAGVVGVTLGVLVAFALTSLASTIFESFGITFTPHVTLRTIVISYCLGFVLTFITVVISSWRTSNLNIVRAIRDIAEPTGTRMGWRGIALWIVGILLSLLLVWAGLSGDAAFPFMAGFTVIVMGASVFATYFGAPARPVYTAMSLFLLVVWGLAAGGQIEVVTGTLDGDIEMFFLSGVAMVTASTFFIIYNSDILLAFLSRVGGAFGPILPALRTAIAYPMANRFRTGMTLAMISLVVFALTTMSAMNLNYDKLFLRDDSRGGWDVQVVENPNNPIASVRGALAAVDSPAASEIETEGALLSAGFDSNTEVTQGDGYDDYPVRGASDGFLSTSNIPLDNIANGYETAEDVWNAVGTEPDVAVVDGFTVEGGFGPSEFALEGVEPDEEKFDRADDYRARLDDGREPGRSGDRHHLVRGEQQLLWHLHG